MPPSNPTAPFDYPQAPSSGAWYIAVALIGHADFTKANPITELALDKIFNQADEISYPWIQEALGRMGRFGVSAYSSLNFKGADYEAKSIFISTGFRNKTRKIVVELHHGALTYLQQLQLAIHQLYVRGDLQPANLISFMKSLNPLLKFDMKEDGRYNGPAMLNFPHQKRKLDNHLI
ncbi:hypothetical protein KBK19_04885 [Microvirga sp. STR05]|uniref:Uncharacterized protein n=1 Tax=Hymenobacter duratus TaxID=2771356 RepID=A0ABR8JEZ0_9BACT|nr:hypothetical protein [Hymenobacter duratus]MBD2714365.1 hypothetical protein [Hymenobacter duratus]MBR7949268.1 hypothetical protein [Microvirga sp. STR05]